MKLAELLKKENNNLDIFRMIAACMVIYGHAYAIAPQSNQTDLIGRMVLYDYSGSIAVKIFFFLSGLVVTNSLLQKRSPLEFIISRFFRIWPGLIAVAVISSLAIMPFFSEFTILDYFSSPKPYRYILDNIFLQTNYDLPGAFLNSPHKGAVNGSLWTIPMEVGAYFGLLTLFMMGIFYSPKLTFIIFLIFIIDPLTGNRLLFTWKTPSFQVDYFIPCFAIGAAMAFFNEHIEINANLALGSIFLYLIFRTSTINFYFLYVAIFLSILYLSSTPFLLKFKFRSDISYGIYLWGFLVQQIMQQLMPQKGTQFNQITSLLISVILGFLSWHLIEKRSIALGKKLINRLRTSASLAENTEQLSAVIK